MPVKKLKMRGEVKLRTGKVEDIDAIPGITMMIRSVFIH